MPRFDGGCKCCGCVVFTESYAVEHAAPWDVRSGAITGSGGEWEMSDGTLAIVTTKPIVGSGHLVAQFEFDFTSLDDEKAGLVFGYQDDDNFNFVILRGVYTPAGFGGTINNTFEYWERRAGSDTLIRSWTFTNTRSGAKHPAVIDLCWQLGDDSIETLLGWSVLIASTRFNFVGVSSMPGQSYGVINNGDPVSLKGDVALGGAIDFSAEKNTGVCRCGCYAPGAQPHSPPELILTLNGVPSPCMPFGEGVSILIECENGDGPPHWERPVAPPSKWDVEVVVGSPDVLRVRWHKTVSTLAVWEKELAGTPTPLWCLSETLTSAHLVSNTTGCDLSGFSIDVEPETVTGVNPTCP